MSNVLDHTAQQQILAPGRLSWTLSRIQEATGPRRETINDYLKAARDPGLLRRTATLLPDDRENCIVSHATYREAKRVQRRAQEGQ